jgi:hypothetical protein
MDALVLKALEKDRDARYQSMAEFLEVAAACAGPVAGADARPGATRALGGANAVAAVQAIRAGARKPGTAVVAKKRTPAPTAESVDDMPAASWPKQKMLVALIGLAMGLGAALWFAFGRGGPATPAPTPSAASGPAAPVPASAVPVAPAPAPGAAPAAAAPAATPARTLPVAEPVAAPEMDEPAGTAAASPAKPSKPARRARNTKPRPVHRSALAPAAPRAAAPLPAPPKAATTPPPRPAPPPPRPPRPSELKPFPE